MSIGDWIGEHWDLYRRGLAGLTVEQPKYAMDLWNIAFSPGDESTKDRALNAWNRTLDFGQMQMGNFGGTISPAADFPVIKQGGAALTWLSKTLVNRPIATAALAADTADRADGLGGQFGAFFSGDNWQKAWNDSRKVTAGQALTYNAAQLFGIVDSNDEKFDPRKSKDAYYSDWFFRTTSGSTDFFLALADPTRGVSKLALLSKAKLVDKTVSAEQIAKGALEQQTFGNKAATHGMSFDEAGGQLAPGVEKLYQQARPGGLPAETFSRLYFNQHAYGGVITSGLYGAAEVGDRALFGDILLAARGSVPANERIAKSPNAAAFAEALGRQRNPYGIANVTMRSADDHFAYEVAEAQAAAADAAIIEQITMPAPLKGSEPNLPQVGPLAEYKDALTGAGLPRVRPLFDSFRIGFHDFGREAYTPAQFVNLHERVIAGGAGIGTVARNAVRIVTPARGYAAHLMTNEVGSYRQFRANLERAGKYMDDETRNRYVTAYMAALDGEGRARVAGHADNFVIGRMAREYGMSAADAERLISEATLRRGRFREMLSRQNKFLPLEFRKRANEMLKAGSREEAIRLKDYADRYEALAKAGHVPGYINRVVDDMGRVTWVIDNNWQNPLKTDRYDRVAATQKLGIDKPLLVSQEADRLPMVDYQKFERSLEQFVAPRRQIEKYEADQARIAAGEAPQFNVTHAQYLKAKADRVMSSAGGLVEDIWEAFNYAWSVAAVLRPAQTLRTLGDDGTRVLTMMGMFPSLLSGMRGVYRIGYSLTRNGMTWAQERNLSKAQRALRAETHFDITMDELGLPRTATQAESESAGYYSYITPGASSAPIHIGKDEVYPTLEAALVNGRIDLETYVAFIPWAVQHGRAPLDLAAIVEDWANGAFRKGEPGRRRFIQLVHEWVDHNLGTLSYTSPRWQADAAEAINLLAYRRAYRESHGLLMNPLGDEAIYTPDGQAFKSHEFIAHRYLHKNPVTNQFDDTEGLYQFAIDHANHLLTGSKLHAKIAPDGRVRLSVVRPRDMPKPITERMTPKQKRDLLKGLQGRGSYGARIVDPATGHRIVIPGVFAGTDGDFARAASSASYIPRTFVDGQRNADRAFNWTNRMDRRDVEPFVEDPAGNKIPNKDWAPAWERMANQQLANDDAARLFLQGRDESHVLAWLESQDPDALRYWNRRPKLGLTIDQHVSVVRGLVDYLAPPEAGQALRDNILNQRATGAELRAAVPEKFLPPVNGQVTMTSLGTHPVLQWVKRRLDDWFHYTQDKPADFLVRYPFMEHKYKQYFQPAYDAYEAQVPGHLITQEEINRIARQARQKAIDDTKRYLYDQTFRTDLANALTPFMPFSNAVADAFFKWAKIGWERPFETAANFNLIFNWPERNGLVYDQDGNPLSYEDGKEVWRSKLDGSVMPDDVKHEKYVAFQFPSWIRHKLPGGLELTTFNKASMTSAIFDPSVNVGPLVALPVNQFALYHPEVGENDFVKRYVLPFGPTSQESRMLLPGLLGAASKWYNDDEDMATSSTMAILQTMITDYKTGKRATEPTLEEAKEQARHEQALRFFTSAGSPISFQYKTPYQPFIDAYSQLLRKYSGDDRQAMTEFREKFGDEYVYLAARVTKSNIALPATIKGYKAFKAKQTAILKYPELASLITGDEGAGSFAKSVYEWEKVQTYDNTNKPIREELTVADSIRDLQKRIGWDDWVKYNAQIENDLARRGLHSINAQGAEDIKQRYAYWITARKYIPDVTGRNELEISPWYEDFKSTDGAAMDSRLVQMQQILMDNPSWLQGRDDLQGLAQYLDMRRTMKRQMDAYGFATLDSQQAAWLQDVWESQVTALRLRNNSFGQLYARWLSRDTLGAQGLAADEIIAALEENNAENTSAPR